MRLALALILAATTIPPDLTAARREFFDALRKGDRAALESILAPDFTFVHSTGVVESRDEYIAHAAKSDVEFLDEAIRVYGDHAAICVSRSVSHRGTPEETNFRATDVFVKAGDSWKLAAVQSTRLPTRPKAIRMTQETLDEFTGAYKVPGGHTLVVARSDTTLTATLPGIRQKELIPVSPTEFVWFSPDSNVDMHLVFGASGVTLRSDGVQRWTATK